MLETQEATFSYDDEGNLIQKVKKNGDTWKYEYYGNGIMSKVIKPDNTEVTFKYDSLGRRIEKSSDEKTTCFVRNGNTILHEYFSQNDSDKFENLDEDSSWSKSEILDNLVTWTFNDGFVPSAKITNEGNYSIISDYLGTPVEAYDEQGNRVWSAKLDIYGRVNEFTGEQDFIPFRYQGQYEDIEIGLYYNRFRYYDPEQGNYTQIDPIGLAGGNPTLYGYVGNPLLWTDPFGLIETYYRTMSEKHYNRLVKNGGIPATGETFISPTKKFAEGYKWVTVEINVKDRTTKLLEEIGVRGQGDDLRALYPNIPEAKKGWNANNVQFKLEDPNINIGLGKGKGKGLEIFNENIESFKVCGRR